MIANTDSSVTEEGLRALVVSVLEKGDRRQLPRQKTAEVAALKPFAFSGWLALAIDSYVDRSNPPKFEVWREVKLGILKKWERAEELLKTEEIVAKDIPWREMSFLASETTVPLVNVTVEELGFSQESTRVGDVYAKALKCGLRLCPDELSVSLVLDLQSGEQLYIADRLGFLAANYKTSRRYGVNYYSRELHCFGGLNYGVEPNCAMVFVAQK